LLALRLIRNLRGIAAVPAVLSKALSVACFILALAAFVPAATAAPPKNKPDFTRYVLTKIKARLPGAELKIEQPLGLKVRYASGGVGRISMLRIWEFCTANDAASCENAIGYFVAGLDEPPPRKDALDRSLLRAGVRTAEILADYQRSMGEGSDRELVSEPLAGDLRIACFLDRPTSLSLVVNADLATLGLSKEEAIALGIRNTVATLKPLTEALMGTPGDAWGHSDGDDYESGRILVHDAPELVNLSAAWGGRLIIAVPGTHTLLYADGRRPDALPALREAVREEMRHSQRPISSTLLLWTKTGWEVIPPLRVTIPPAPAADSTARRSRVAECGRPGRRRGRRRLRRASLPPFAGDRALSRLPS
jgi:hypothetical protein